MEQDTGTAGNCGGPREQEAHGPGPLPLPVRPRTVFVAHWFGVWRCRWPGPLAHEWDPPPPRVRRLWRWLIVMKGVRSRESENE